MIRVGFCDENFEDAYSAGLTLSGSSFNRAVGDHFMEIGEESLLLRILMSVSPRLSEDIVVFLAGNDSIFNRLLDQNNQFVRF